MMTRSARQRRPMQVLLLSGIVAASTIVNAATIYSEDQVGDFHGGQIFTLNDPQSQFTGGHTWGAPDPFDGIRFVVPTGQQAVVSIRYTFADLSAGEKQAWIWDLSSLPDGTGGCTPGVSVRDCLFVPSQQPLISEIVQSEPGFVPPPDPSFARLDQVTLGSGIFLLNDNFGFDNLGASNTATGRLTYTISIDMTPVPLPATLPMLGISLLATMRLAARRGGSWRRKNSIRSAT